MKNVIILTGCSGNLGSQILLNLLQSYYVIGISRNSQSIKINNEFKERFITLDCDFTIQTVEDVNKKIKNVIEQKDLFLKGLVNNAIFNYPKSPLSIDLKSCADSLEGIFSYHIRLSLSLFSLFSPPSSIVNISSMYGKVSPDPSMYKSQNKMNPLLYGSFKAAFIQSTKYLSSIFSESNIRVNSVSYGPFPSKKVIDENPDFIKELAKRTHLKRVGLPSESVGIIKFLLSEESSYITGADIPVDGGWTIW